MIQVYRPVPSGVLQSGVESLRTALETFACTELGFTLFGVTGAEPLAGRRHLVGFLRKGWYGTMGWLARAPLRRGRPRALLAGARSVICLAMSYRDASGPDDAPPDRTALVARYAQRRDYHKVIGRRLIRLGRRLAELRPGTNWTVAVDTRPLLEKGLAERAGVGFIGRNTCLINRRFGSELLLGELICDAPLPVDSPELRRCGECRACIEACPTGALIDGWRLDARRCISYLTIEHRGDLPPALIPAIGAHLFGCDICQTVCPWNRRAPVSCAAPLASRPLLQVLAPAMLEALDEAGWIEVAAGSPLRRIGYSTFRRNLAAVASNLQGEAPHADDSR